MGDDGDVESGKSSALAIWEGRAEGKEAPRPGSEKKIDLIYASITFALSSLAGHVCSQHFWSERRVVFTGMLELLRRTAWILQLQ